MFLKRNPNEVNYVHGKKHWTDVIKNTGDKSLLIWRQPEEDFNTNSTLIVMPGEQAIFISQGEIVEVFDNGTYQLKTENYPFIGRLKRVLSGGISTFNCVVYFVRKASGIEIKWGTDSPIQVRDKVLGIATKLRARGAYKVKIENPELFLRSLSGNQSSFSQDELNNYFRNEFQSKIKSFLSLQLQLFEGEILGVDAHLEEFSELISPKISSILKEYGILLQTFSVSGIDIVDNNLREQYDKVGVDSFSKLQNARSDVEVMNILGENWGNQQSVDIMKSMAQNGLNIGAEIGAGVGMVGAFSNIANATVTQQVSQEDPIKSLEKAKQLLDAGLLTQEEFDQKKQEILSRL